MALVAAALAVVHCALVGSKLCIHVGTVHCGGAEAVRKIVLLAPGVIPPWTEGRKIFVTDLVVAMRARGLVVDLLNGEPAASPSGMILGALRQLRTICSATNAADAVLVFPYGTFHGFRGRINSWLL